MARVDEDTDGLLEATRRQLGRTPNLYRTMANSPAALRGYLALRAELSRGALPERLREQIALLVASENACTYCVSAHTLRATRLGLDEQEIEDTRRAHDTEPHAAAVLQMAREVTRTNGDVDDDVLDKARTSGVSDPELAEIVAHVALNTFSNYFNHLARPELDFPKVQA